MKKIFLLWMAFSLSVSSAVIAQTSATPEVPRNYKPQARELLPMPGELTDEMIFPVLGKYEYVAEEGEVPANVTITRDPENKGVVWINGLPQGRFKADLKMSPAIYKIPAQKTLMNQSEDEVQAAVDSVAEMAEPVAAKNKVRYSGKSIKEGTLLYDSASHKLFVNVGAKFNEAEPASVFPELEEMMEPAESVEAVNSTTGTAMKKPAKKKSSPAGTKYVLTKVPEVASVPNSNGW